MPADRKSVSVDRNASDDSKQKEADKKLKMNGLLIDDPEIITAMEKDGAGKYLPVTVNNDTVSGNFAVGKHQMEQVLNYVKKRVSLMADHLQAGQVEDLPLRGKGEDDDACEYCPYFPVCCHEETDGENAWDKINKSEQKKLVLEQIRQEMGEEEAQ